MSFFFFFFEELLLLFVFSSATLRGLDRLQRIRVVVYRFFPRTQHRATTRFDFWGTLRAHQSQSPFGHRSPRFQSSPSPALKLCVTLLRNDCDPIRPTLLARSLEIQFVSCWSVKTVRSTVYSKIIRYNNLPI